MHYRDGYLIYALPQITSATDIALKYKMLKEKIDHMDLQQEQ
jgi:hypothetical protein